MDVKSAVRGVPPPLPGVTGLPLASSPLPFPAQPVASTASRATRILYPADDISGAHDITTVGRYLPAGRRFRRGAINWCIEPVPQAPRLTSGATVQARSAHACHEGFAGGH